MSIILPDTAVHRHPFQKPIRYLFLLELQLRSQRAKVMIPTRISRVVHHHRRHPRLFYFVKSAFIIRLCKLAFWVGRDRIAIGEDGVCAELPALKIAFVAYVCHERHLVHGKPPRMPNPIRSFTILVPVSFLPVVKSENLPATFEDS